MAKLARDRRIALVALLLAGAVVVAAVLGLFGSEEALPSLEEQACSVPAQWLELTRRGYFAPRSGQIALLPRYPAYFAQSGTGWTHSGPWPYLQKVPIVFYGPGIIPSVGEVARRATVADVAPTIMTMLRGSFRTEDGRRLREVANFNTRLLESKPPKLILTVVWDGGGWNALRQWPNDWPNLARIMSEGVTYTNAIVGSSPSVTPSVHTTLGTGVFPATHGITGIPVRYEDGSVGDVFLRGESSRFLRVPTVAELWDERNRNRALIGMVGYEPWHLGMIGQGAERLSGDKDDAVWLDVETNEWITNERHYHLPSAFEDTEGRAESLEASDAQDGEIDDTWRGHEIIDDPDRIEEVPGFITYHAREMMEMIRDEGYGEDEITDLLFTNFKQIDRLGHYFNMASDEVHDAVIESDKQLGVLTEFLDDQVGRGRWALVVTADHGQQPDAAAVDGFGIDPRELEDDVDAEFGPITEAAWPTEVFLKEEEMAERDVSIEEVARFLGDYRLADNTQRPDYLVGGAGRFDASDRIFAMAIPSRLLGALDCR
ncbi:MAG: alkaline phosphatase family protein [Actinomycetota bacterium]